METKFTPGPWKWSEHWIWRENIISATQKGKAPQIAYISYDKGSVEQQANARLIECAPDMFKALHDILQHTPHIEHSDELTVALNDAQQILLKATTI